MNKKLLLVLYIFNLFLVSCSKEPPPPINTLIFTTNATSITSDGADCGGSITSDGGSTITQRGICWSTSSTPTINDNKTINGSGLGSYSSHISGLTANTNCYVRAFATNGYGTFYGNQITFKTDISLATVYTTNASSITSISAMSGGNITTNGGATITQRGVCWSTSTPTTANSKTINGTGSGAFTSNISSLNSNTIYYIRAYATNSLGTSYGNEVSFTTSLGIPVINTTSPSSITSTTALSGGTITSSGSSSITQKGVCWSTITNPNTSNNKTIDGIGTGNFSSFISALSPNTTYYVKAYAVNSFGTAYGNEVSFITSATSPILTTTNATFIGQTTATIGGNISSDGGATITQRGVCWSTSTAPTTSNNKTNNGTGTGSFSSNISGLSSNTTYYVRAYATNSIGTAYGNEVSITTSANLATLTTTSATSIAQTTATSGGNISSDGGATITQRGVCWNTSTLPTTINNITNNGTGIGSFVSNITGLVPNTTYYVRAYATNSAGTKYGNQVSFVTTSATLATLTTTSITAIGLTNATSGGNISSDGGATITQRGVCWNTSTAPITLNNITSNGTGIGSFTSSITGLIPSTIYYVRAYATNSAGTKYGNEYNFTTAFLGIPTLSSPFNGATVPCCNVNFSWSTVSNATSYEINISRNSTFSGTTSTIAVCGGASYPSLTLLNTAIVTSPNFCMSTGTNANNGTWYWRVRAKNGAITGNWSAIRNYVKN